MIWTQNNEFEPKTTQLYKPIDAQWKLIQIKPRRNFETQNDAKRGPGVYLVCLCPNDEIFWCFLVNI